MVAMKKRALYQRIWDDLSAYKSMILLAGPRQAGKTTLARMIAEKFSNSLYFNYDILENKKQLVENPRFYESVNRKDNTRPLIMLDEIHKFYNWKNYLKDIYDRDGKNYLFLVTGSGRLNIYQKGGDSLAGRYLFFHLWPFTIAEVTQRGSNLRNFLANVTEVNVHDEKGTRHLWQTLAHFSGFPEPFLTGKREFYTLWSRDIKRQILREDVRDLMAIRRADQLELLLSLLPSRVGSPVAIDNLARDIGVSFDSVRNWLDLFDHFFLTFRIAPWTQRVARSILKEKKVYLMDYAGIESAGARFENMVAMELFRAVQTWNDSGLGDFSLHYVRNKEQNEVDFLVAGNHKPLFLVETKLSDDQPASTLKAMQALFGIPAVQLIDKPGVYKRLLNGGNQLIIVTAEQWLSGLP